MALVRFGGGVADARGSLAGVTFSRSAAGATMRQRVKPVRIRNNATSAARSRFGYLASLWTSTLTDTKRIAWAGWSAGSPWKNALGDPITLKGADAYIRVNGIRALAGLPRLDDPPTALGMAASPGFTITGAVDGTHLSIVAAPTGWNPLDPLDTLVLFNFPPCNGGRNIAPAGRRYWEKLSGATPVPPTFPMSITTGYTARTGNRMFVECVHVDTQGRVSVPVLANVLANFT
jgi:hypothetical protein